MTSETSDQAQIQALINGIDEALNKTSPRLPWVMSNDAAQQRQVLEQTRQYLTALQQKTESERLSLPPEAAASRLAVPDRAIPDRAVPEPVAQPPAESAQQVLQAVLQEMNYWRVNMLQPLRTEIDSLQRQREMLTQEIRQLETQRQHHPGAQPNQQLLMEFLQSAMAQMQANLSGQVTQMIAGQMQSGQPALSASAALTPAERLAQMQAAQTQSDQLMLKLDSTLQVIFESLNRNVQIYEESLEQGLNRMHSLGQQGEAMFAFLVNRLAQQLGREASTFLQASAPNNWQQVSALPAEAQPDSPVSETGETKTADFLSQIPHSSQVTFVPAVPFDLSEEVLDISELELLDQPLDQPLDNNLQGLDLELRQLDLSAIPPIPETPSFDLFAGSQPLPTVPVRASGSEIPADSPVMNDLDSALDLLNQLSAEMQSSLTQPDLTSDLTTGAAPQPTLASETEFITIPDTLYDDAFYSGTAESGAIEGESIEGESIEGELSSDSLPLDAVTLEQSWFDGLGDPAAELPLETTPQPDSSGWVNQTLETFLLSNSAPTAADPDLFAEFTEPSQPVPDLGPAISEEAAPLETIATLMELIPPNSDFDSLNAAESDLEPAPPESLPIAEAPIQDFEVDLGSHADGLAQLSADLTQASSAPPSEWSAESAATGWDLFALPNADPVVPDPALPNSELNSNPPPVTIEGLEGLFEDLPDVETTPQPDAQNISQIEATPDLFAQLKAAFSQDAGTPIETEQPIVLKYLNPDAADSAAADSSDSEKKK